MHDGVTIDHDRAAARIGENERVDRRAFGDHELILRPRDRDMRQPRTTRMFRAEPTAVLLECRAILIDDVP